MSIKFSVMCLNEQYYPLKGSMRLKDLLYLSSSQINLSSGGGIWHLRSLPMITYFKTMEALCRQLSWIFLSKLINYAQVEPPQDFILD
jgi:hypothetical protein